MTAPTVRVRVPMRFYDDHVSRDLPAGEIVKITKGGYRIELDAESYDDLLSDARYYVDAGVGVFGSDAIGLISSARATVAALGRVDRPADATVADTVSTHRTERDAEVAGSLHHATVEETTNRYATFTDKDTQATTTLAWRDDREDRQWRYGVRAVGHGWEVGDRWSAWRRVGFVSASSRDWNEAHGAAKAMADELNSAGEPDAVICWNCDRPIVAGADRWTCNRGPSVYAVHADEIDDAERAAFGGVWVLS